MMSKRKKVGKIQIGVSGTREEEGCVSFSVGCGRVSSRTYVSGRQFVPSSIPNAWHCGCHIARTQRIFVE